MCEEALVKISEDNDSSFSGDDDCPESEMISLSESMYDSYIDGESLTSEDWEELRDVAMALRSRTISDEISIEIPCNALLSIRNAADLSCNSSVCSGLSMDCDDDDDELHFS
jgi:hypothetical protein